MGKITINAREFLDIIEEKGVEGWNKLVQPYTEGRTENSILVNLEGAELAGLDLTGIVLSNKKIKTIMSGANIEGTDFSNAILNELKATRITWNSATRFIEADLSAADVSYAIKTDTGEGPDFEGSNLRGLKANKTDFREAVFYDANCNGLDGSGGNFHGALFEEVRNLVNANFDDAEGVSQEVRDQTSWEQVKEEDIEKVDGFFKYLMNAPLEDENKKEPDPVPSPTSLETFLSNQRGESLEEIVEPDDLVPDVKEHVARITEKKGYDRPSDDPSWTKYHRDRLGEALRWLKKDMEPEGEKPGSERLTVRDILERRQRKEDRSGPAR